MRLDLEIVVVSNERPALDAANDTHFTFEVHWRRASEAQR